METAMNAVLADVPQADTPPTISPTDATSPADAVSTSEVPQTQDAYFFGNDPCWTPEIDAACQQLIQWIMDDMPGAGFQGPSRTGKTCFTRYALPVVPRFFNGSLISIRWATRSCTKRDDLAWVRERMMEVDCYNFNHTSPALLIRRLTNHLVSVIESNAARRVLILVDQAELMSLSQLGMVADVFDELSDHARVFVASVGEPWMSKKISTAPDEQARRKLMRFFPLTHEFRGIALHDLSSTLASLDSASGESAVAKHFPTLAARGWTLDQAGNAFALAVEALRMEHNIGHQVRVPMEYVRCATNRLLYMLKANPEAGLNLMTSETIQACLCALNYPAIMGLYQA